MRAPDPDFRAFVDRAKAVPIEEVAAQRHLQLRGRVERVGPCPNCGGDPRRADRFSINTAKQLFHCRKCGDGGDVIALVQFLDRCDFIAACSILTGESPPRGEGHGPSPEELAAIEAERAERRRAQEAQSADFRERERRRLWSWWRAALHPARTPVEDYLALRKVSLPPGAALRYMPRLKLHDSGAYNAPVVHEGPAMLAAILSPEGRFSGLHITWIDLSAPDGKARVADRETGELIPAKKVRGTMTGGRIELVRLPAPRALVIGEGIETTLSPRDALLDLGQDLSGVAFWSGIALGNIGGRAAYSIAHPSVRLTDKKGRERAWKIPGPVPDLNAPAIPIPESVEEIILLGDGDSDPFLTRTTLERAARRWQRPGLVVRGAFADAGKDFNTMRRAAA